jgi:hypothetical protein
MRDVRESTPSAARIIIPLLSTFLEKGITPKEEFLKLS